jgi:hypothetical protein
MKAALAAILLAGYTSLSLRVVAVDFVVASPPCYSPPTDQSVTNAYILPINSPADITKARVLVATGGCIVLSPGFSDFRPVFEIGLGSDGTNRNVALPGQPLWSWHVQKLLGWADGTIPEYPYTHPFEIERAVLSGTLTNGDQLTLKGAYTTAREVNPALALYMTEYDSTTQSRCFLLYWTHDAPNTTYTVEWSDSLSPGDWKPLAANMPGVDQLGDKAWLVPGSPAHRFFRLRTDPIPATEPLVRMGIRREGGLITLQINTGIYAGGKTVNLIVTSSNVTTAASWQWRNYLTVFSKIPSFSLIELTASVAPQDRRFYQIRAHDGLIASEQRREWTALGFTNYQFRLTRTCSCTPTTLSGTVTVNNGRVVAVTDARGPDGLPIENPDLSQFKSVEELFDLAHQAGEQYAADVCAVAYDESLFYPTIIEIDYNAQTVGDEFTYEASDVQALAP